MTAAPSAELLASWTWHTRTRSGAPFCIRPLRPDDREREIAFINSLSDASRYFRLLTPLRVLPPHLLDQLMDIDYDRRMALVATVCVDRVERLVGLARYGEMDGPDTVELGITVTDEWQRQGIAQRLVTELMRFAREHGVRRVEGNRAAPEPSHACPGEEARLRFPIRGRRKTGADLAAARQRLLNEGDGCVSSRLWQAALLKNGALKIYKGFPHGMPTTNAETINADLLAFLKS